MKLLDEAHHCFQILELRLHFLLPSLQIGVLCDDRPCNGKESRSARFSGELSLRPHVEKCKVA